MSDSNESADESITVDIDDFMATLNNGELGNELMERLRDVVTRVRETGRKGHVQLRLGVELGGARQIEITPEVKSKEPKTSHAQRIFFADKEGHLYRKDPTQQELPLRRPDGADEKTAQSVNAN